MNTVTETSLSFKNIQSPIPETADVYDRIKTLLTELYNQSIE